MKSKLLLCASASVYYLLAGYLLYAVEADVLVVALALFGLPAYVLARYSAAPASVIIAVAVFGSGIALLLEGIAHIYGLWETTGFAQLQQFGLIPLEVLAGTVLQVLFLALLYELVFDDGIYAQVRAHVRFAAFGVFSLSVLLLIAVHHYVLAGTFLPYSYVWILCILVGASLAALAVYRFLSLRFFKRVFLFCICACVPLLANLFLVLANGHKLFIGTETYLFSFNILGSTLPLEEVLLVFVMPFFVATIYELYLDDRN